MDARPGKSMHRIVRILVTIVPVCLVAAAVAPASADAATATTLPATQVTAVSAVLNGVVNTGGVDTAWQFQYGRTTSYGVTTPVHTTGPGLGTLGVSQQVMNLRPGTVYHFRLIVTSGNGTVSYPIKTNHGNDVTFKTGKLILLRRKLAVTNGTVSIPLKCASRHKCLGALSITKRTKVHGKSKTVTCATKSFAIRGGHKKSVKARVSGACQALLSSARNHKLGATFKATTTTGQPIIRRRVTLNGT